ncbi:sensor histidine kinase [Schlesneria sp. T3-172]|uniref:sensor histidine kinase n=1 Tax=Schlesneria TaxID=656899 RepID=UPI002EF0616A
MAEPAERPETPIDAQKIFVLPDRDRLEALAEFAAGAGHEINNPLATIIGRAQMLLKEERDPQRRQMLMSIGAQAYRVRDMIGDAMLFGRPPQPEPRAVLLSEIVAQAITRQAELLASGRCQVVNKVPESLSLHADPTQLAIVVSELMRNAVQAMHPEGGVIEISAQAQLSQAVIEITDCGKGFTEIERQHAFDPFFSGRQAGRGLGFGLCKCWRIVDQHRGQIEIMSDPGGPTTVRILWPCAEKM